MEISSQLPLLLQSLRSPPVPSDEVALTLAGGTEFNVPHKKIMYCPKKELKIQQRSLFVQALQNQSLYLNCLLCWASTSEHKWEMPPNPGSTAGTPASPRDSSSWACAEQLMPALLTLLQETFWDYALKLRWDLSTALALQWRGADLTRSTAGEQSAGHSKGQQESMKSPQVTRKAATFTPQGRF